MNDVQISAAGELAEIEESKRIAEMLHRHYPGHAWGVRCTGGVAIVQNMALSGKWGFVLHSDKLQGPDAEKRVMRAGGELLERYRISRAKAGVEQAVERFKAVMARPSLDSTAPC